MKEELAQALEILKENNQTQIIELLNKLDEDKKDALETVKSIYEDFRNKPDGERFANQSGGWWYRLWGVDILDKLDDAVEKLIGV